MKIKKSEDSKRKCISDIMYIINLIQELERYSSFRFIRKRKLSKEIDEELDILLNKHNKYDPVDILLAFSTIIREYKDIIKNLYYNDIEIDDYYVLFKFGTSSAQCFRDYGINNEEYIACSVTVTKSVTHVFNVYKNRNLPMKYVKSWDVLYKKIRYKMKDIIYSIAYETLI